MLFVFLGFTHYPVYDRLCVAHPIGLFIDLFPDVVCVSWVHPLPSLWWALCCSSFWFASWLVHQYCLCLVRSPPVISNKINVVNVVLLSFVFTFKLHVLKSVTISKYKQRSVCLYPQLLVWRMMSYFWYLYMFPCKAVQRVFTIWFSLCVLFVYVLCVVCLMPLSLDCS